MEELHELIKYLKDNGCAHLKINPDLLVGIIEYFASKQETKQCTITDVGCSLPSKDEKLIGNMCLSFRHDFGLLPKLIQDDLKRDCKNWLISYENNRK